MNMQEIDNAIQLPPEMQEAYERTVIAGMKVLFSKETHPMMLEQLNAPGSNAEKLGTGIARVLVFLYQESNQTMPIEVVVPAAIKLIMKTAEFLNESGKAQVSDQEIGQAVEIMIGAIFEGFGEDPAQLDALMEQEMPA